MWELYTDKYPLGQVFAVIWFCIELLKTNVNLRRMWRSWLIWSPSKGLYVRPKFYSPQSPLNFSVSYIFIGHTFPQDTANRPYFIYHVGVNINRAGIHTLGSKEHRYLKPDAYTIKISALGHAPYVFPLSSHKLYSVIKPLYSQAFWIS